MSNIEEETSFEPTYVNQEDFNPQETVSDFLSNTAFDPSRLHPLANLGSGMQYLDLEDQGSTMATGHGIVPSRSWTDDMTYGTGMTYITGLSLGGAYGFFEGLRSSPSPALRIRVNTVLNSMTRRGPFIGNSAGVLALMYNGINSAIGSARGHHDPLNSVAAGALTGALFKSTAGVRAAGTAGGVCAVAAGLWSVAREKFL
ncbi:Mitochondrial import inner membrane translocase subunit tim23 [Actinomortierella ambigua]|uniref:Mitochondrial import inner membrane translocase subunit tim23 n=1 Tax=Actinomortierella ambigua TaxID=1343610 RepID=A0A9P6UAV1_9FUNG|nr:Mitochondrial import inner membrane translocase subunit tim23 [Actinomortierella ambigua]